MELNVGDTVFFCQSECIVIKRWYDRGNFMVELMFTETDEIHNAGATITRNEEIFSI